MDDTCCVVFTLLLDMFCMFARSVHIIVGYVLYVSFGEGRSQWCRYGWDDPYGNRNFIESIERAWGEHQGFITILYIVNKWILVYV